MRADTLNKSPSRWRIPRTTISSSSIAACERVGALEVLVPAEAAALMRQGWFVDRRKRLSAWWIHHERLVGTTGSDVLLWWSAGKANAVDPGDSDGSCDPLGSPPGDGDPHPACQGWVMQRSCDHEAQSADDVTDVEELIVVLADGTERGDDEEGQEPNRNKGPPESGPDEDKAPQTGTELRVLVQLNAPCDGVCCSEQPHETTTPFVQKRKSLKGEVPEHFGRDKGPRHLLEGEDEDEGRQSIGQQTSSAAGCPPCVVRQRVVWLRDGDGGEGTDAPLHTLGELLVDSSGTLAVVSVSGCTGIWPTGAGVKHASFGIDVVCTDETEDYRDGDEPKDEDDFAKAGEGDDKSTGRLRRSLKAGLLWLKRTESGASIWQGSVVLSCLQFIGAASPCCSDHFCWSHLLAKFDQPCFRCEFGPVGADPRFVADTEGMDSASGEQNPCYHEPHDVSISM